MLNVWIILILIINSIAMIGILVLLIRIEKKIDMSGYWKETLDKKVRAIFNNIHDGS